MNVSKELLTVFLTAMQKGSFSAAARHLNRAPSAVSMAIANLEAELNLNLFDRTGREPVPTPQALSLATQAVFLVKQMQQWEAQALALSQGLESKLSLAIEPELLSMHWVDYIAPVAARFPQLEIEIMTAPHEDAMQMLHEGRVQLALLYERSEFDGRESFCEVFREELVAVAAPSHALLQQEGAIHLDQLMSARQLVVASREQPHSAPRLLWSHVYWRTDSHIAALNLTLTGLGWSILPRSFVAPYVEAQQLCILEIQNLTNSFPLCVDWVWSRQHALGMAAQYLVSLIDHNLPKHSVS